VIEEALLLMARSSRRKVVPLRDQRDGADDSVPGEAALGESLRDASVIELPRVEGPRRFPTVSTLPRLPVMIPDEILDYYGWVFCQGGFLNLHMTFEQFLAVVAAVSPSGLCPEYDESGALSASD
jgi:hypothetical protein